MITCFLPRTRFLKMSFLRRQTVKLKAQYWALCLARPCCCFGFQGSEASIVKEFYSGRKRKPQNFQRHKKWPPRKRSAQCLMGNTASLKPLTAVKAEQTVPEQLKRAARHPTFTYISHKNFFCSWENFLLHLVFPLYKVPHLSQQPKEWLPKK